MKVFRFSRLGAVAGFSALAVGIALAASPAQSDPIDEVPSGTKLGKGNWELAKGLLPDEILEFYKRGDYSNPIIQKPGSDWLIDPNMAAATKANAGKYDIDENGTVVESATGKRPPVITGLPFPEISASDPKYDWKGSALGNWAISAMPLTKAPTRDGSDFWLRTGGGGSAAFAVNYKQDRATVSGMPVEPTEYYVQIPDEIYEVDRVNRMGK